MRRFIGPALVSSIQEYSLSVTVSQDEIDVISEESNVILDSADEGQEIELSFTIIPGLTVDDKSIEVLRNEFQNLTNEDYRYIPVNLFDEKGFISVQEVSIPENSSSQTIYTGTLSGHFLPWPKHLSQVDFEARRQEVLPDIPAFFEVKTVSTNSPITEGSKLFVDSKITNEGVNEEAKNVELFDFVGDTVDSESLSLSEFNTESVQLSWQTEVGDAGVGNIEVSTNDDSLASTVIIEELTDFFEVLVQSTNSPIKETQTLEVTVSVENTGMEQGNQKISLSNLTQDTVDSENISLNASESQSLTLSWNTVKGDVGTGEVQVSSENTSDPVEIVIQELLEAFFDVTISSTNSPIKESQSLDVTVSVENTGEEMGEKEIRLLDFDSNVVDSQTITLNASETQSVTLSWDTDFGDEGSGDVVVETDDSSDMQEVTIEIGFW